MGYCEDSHGVLRVLTWGTSSRHLLCAELLLRLAADRLQRLLARNRLPRVPLTQPQSRLAAVSPTQPQSVPLSCTQSRLAAVSPA